MLIINHGHLVAESSLDDLTARVGGAVRVRSPQLPRLAEELRRQGFATTDIDGHALLAVGTTPERVGDIAFAAGIALHELTSGGSSLEEVFLELTSEVQS